MGREPPGRALTRCLQSICMKGHKSRSSSLERNSKNSNHKSHSNTLFNILNKQKKDTEASGKLIRPLKHPPLPFLGSARRWDIWCVCIHPPLYTCHTLEERCGDFSPPLNTNEQLAVSCLGIRDDAEQRARSPRNEWCLSAQQEPHTLNHRSTHAYAPITTFFTRYHRTSSLMQFSCSDASWHTNK